MTTTTPTATFLRDGRLYERCPCTDWPCDQPHVTLRTGPAFGSFHPVPDCIYCSSPEHWSQECPS